MYSADAPRDRFASGALDTASGPQIVVMCFERLDRDLAGALDAMDGNDLFTVNDKLQHAQDLLIELIGMLDLDQWEHAESLASIYAYVLRRIEDGNVTKDRAMIDEARRLLAELGDGFRGALDELRRPDAPPPGPAATGTEGAPARSPRPPGSFSVQA